ncbi:hypothetical protein, partial [Klebsiella pneumoniae]|uniref:hypothetical protein n=1 Tax=Klebsiella pneumoniae TaxID=573 RepID=UPI0025A2447A
VDYGTVIVAPSDPVKDGNDQNNYVFVGWEGYTEGMTVTKDVEFKATFSSVTNKYTYKFLNEDGSVIEEKTVDFGTVIEKPSDPVKVGNEQYS